MLCGTPLPTPAALTPQRKPKVLFPRRQMANQAACPRFLLLLLLFFLLLLPLLLLPCKQHSKGVTSAKSCNFNKSGSASFHKIN
eukprot:TsM_000331100 transcript=TsM_000331100 gene=TsM_000331100